jgi:hypothetical protein
VATVRADEFREGLLAQRRGDGRHGFSLSLPARLRDGQSHRIRARFAGTELDLEDSPASFRYLSK